MIVQFEMYGYDIEARTEPADHAVGVMCADILEMQIMDEGVEVELEDLEPWIRRNIEEETRLLAGRIT